MNKPKTKPFLILIFLFLLFHLNSCNYEYIEIDEPDLDIPVKFTETILPLFTAHKCVVCHQSNYTRIDFTSDNAYNTIVPELVDTLQPELSKIYTFPNPSSSLHQFKKYTPTEAAQVLNWIKQGAQNN